MVDDNIYTNKKKEINLVIIVLITFIMINFLIFIITNYQHDSHYQNYDLYTHIWIRMLFCLKLDYTLEEMMLSRAQICMAGQKRWFGIIVRVRVRIVRVILNTTIR